MNTLPDPSVGAVHAALEREVALVNDAIALVATGGAPRVVVAGLSLGEQILPTVQRMADDAGVRLVPRWGADEHGVEIAVERIEP